MTYDGSPEKRTQLHLAMKKLHKDHGVKDSEVHREITSWCREDPGFSAKTYGRYRTSGKMSNYNSCYKIYDFLSRGPIQYRMLSHSRNGARANTEDERFMDAFLERFGPSGRSYDQSSLEGFRFTYELFRRSWKIDDGKHFVRTLLKVEKENGIFNLTETVKFGIGDNEVSQTDTGVIFPYESNFCALCNSSKGLKFFSFHDHDPPSNGFDPVDELKGNLVAVTGNREHPSFRVFGRRIRSGSVVMGQYHVDAFKGDSSMKEVLRYILPSSEQTRENWYHE